MKALNNYFQKATAILVVFMLLVIPNLHVYSSIGSYQTDSPAVIANKAFIMTKPENKQCCSYKSEQQRVAYPIFGTPITLTTVAMRSIFESLAQQKDYHVSDSDYVTTFSDDGSTCGAHSLSSKDNYAKYDFSGFDN